MNAAKCRRRRTARNNFSHRGTENTEQNKNIMAEHKPQVPSVGRIVNAVVQIHEGAHAELVIRPAIIVHVWPVEGKGVVETTVQAQVFMDGDGGPSNDGTPNVVWKSSLQYDETGKLPHSWHWPKRG